MWGQTIRFTFDLAAFARMRVRTNKSKPQFLHQQKRISEYLADLWASSQMEYCNMEFFWDNRPSQERRILSIQAGNIKEYIHLSNLRLPFKRKGVKAVLKCFSMFHLQPRTSIQKTMSSLPRLKAQHIMCH